MPTPEDINGAVSSDDSNNSGNNPAWQEFLDVVPQELHERVTPVLQKWDQGVQSRFNEINGKYEPWKDIIGSGIDPKETQFALNLLSTVNENPELVYNALGQYYNLTPGGIATNNPANEQQQGKGSQESQELNTDEPWKNDFQEMQNNMRLMADVIYKNQQADAARQADVQLEQELVQATEKFKDHAARLGPFDENYVLGLMSNGMDTTTAVETFYKMPEGMANKFSPKPLIMGGGGGLPGQNSNPAKMSDAEVKGYVANLIQAANQQQRL